jgi:hypothetical protein
MMTDEVEKAAGTLSFKNVHMLEILKWLILAQQLPG